MCNRQLTDSTSGDRTLSLSFSFRSFTGVARPVKNAKLNGTAAVYHSINYEERPRNCFAARKRGEKVGGKKEKKKKKRAATNYGELCQVYGAPRTACRFHFDFCFFLSFFFFSKSRPSFSLDFHFSSLLYAIKDHQAIENPGQRDRQRFCRRR